jgi:tRNA threonylcarbamoyladenosine biosynthesis protein TsaB
MNFLAVDTSASYLTVIVTRGEDRFVSYLEKAGMKHSTLLLPEIDRTLKEANLTLDKLDYFAVVIGAGSFTGIRIGVSTIKALAKSTKKPAVAVTSFDTMAYNMIEEKVLALIDAKHGHYYACGYHNGVVDLPPAYLPESEVLSLSAGRKVLSVEPLAVNSEIVSPVEGLFAAATKKADLCASAEDLIPLYVRKSQAEEGR